MSEPAQKVTINCAAWGARALFQDAMEWRVKAEDAEAAGDPVAAGHYTHQAEACRTAGRNSLIQAGLPDADSVEPETRTDLTAAELAQRVLDAAAAQARSTARDSFLANHEAGGADPTRTRLCSARTFPSRGEINLTGVPDSGTQEGLG